MNLRCTIILCISRKKKMLQINSDLPLILRHILTSEMWKWGKVPYLVLMNYGIIIILYKWIWSMSQYLNLLKIEL